MDNKDVEFNHPKVKEILDFYGIKASKTFGQNFLTDANIPAKIVSLSGIDKKTGVLEVGPGLGALTKELYKAAGHVTAVELDKRLVPILKDIFENKENISIIQGDILKLNINDILKETMPGLSYHVCANLPYNITTPAITAFIEAGNIDTITIMIQKEVARRICAQPATSEYGAFTVYANYHTTSEILFDVAPECFTPRPKVTSSVIRMKIKPKPLLSKDDEARFFKVVRAGFGQRRKTLLNALFSTFEKTHSKEEIAGIIINSGFDVNVRAEVLGINDFVKLSSKL